MSPKKPNYFERAVPSIDEQTCNACGACVKVCGGQPLTMADGKVHIDPNPTLGCFACGQCMMVCPTGSVTVRGRDLSPEDLVQLPDKERRDTADQLEDLLTSRRSVRFFKKQEVDMETVERIVRMASTAPMGIPPSHVCIKVFHGLGEVRAFSDDVMGCINRTMKFLSPMMLRLMRPFIGKAAYESMREFVLPIGEAFASEGGSGEDPLLYGAPLALLFHHSPYADPADPYIAATYSMMAAESLGLGTCMIGMVAPFMERDKKLMRKYGIPKGNRLSIVVIAGHPDVKFRRCVRRRFASVSYSDRSLRPANTNSTAT